MAREPASRSGEWHAQPLGFFLQTGEESNICIRHRFLRDVFRFAETTSRGGDTRDEVHRTRVWIVIISLAAATFALLPFTQDIIRMTKFSGSLYGACFLPVLVLGLFVRRRVAGAALATMSLGSVCVVGVFVLRAMGITSMQEVYPGIASGILVFCVSTRLAVPAGTSSRS